MHGQQKLKHIGKADIEVMYFLTCALATVTLEPSTSG